MIRVALLLANLIILATFLLTLNRMPPEIPLFYSRSRGENQIAPWWIIVLLPLLMNGLALFNMYLKKKFFSNEHFISYVLDIASISSVVVIVMIYLKIILLIT